MSFLEVRNNDQKLADAAQFQHLQRWRAAQTVRSRVTEQAECQELLACLDLLDVAPPAVA